MAKNFICPDCGQPYLRAWEHACKKAKRVEDKAPPTPKIRDVVPPAKKATEALLVNKPSTVHSKSLKRTRKEPLSTERNRRWREANRERSREYMRNYMREWRSRSE